MVEKIERVLVLWIPDWPIHAHRSEHLADEPDATSRPLALIAQHRVVACSAEARQMGVLLGIREQEARSRCPELEIHPHDPESDARGFAPVLTAIEETVPGVEPLRPGLCAMRARGPARYYGSEEAAAEALLARVAELGFSDARAGVAAGRFAAEQATRAQRTDPGVHAPAPGVRIVHSEHTSAFLAPLPVARAAPPEFAEVLQRLGIRTLGALAALPEDAVRERFGSPGVNAWRRARGWGPAHAAEVRPRTPEVELAVATAFEPPLDGADQLAFACSALAESFVRGVLAHGLVCTEVRVELTDDLGIRHERSWAHPTRFTPVDVINRVRWQAGAVPRDVERGGSGIAEVRLTPVRTAHAAQHEPGLWNSAPDARVHHHLSRVQSLVGHEGVGTGELVGGRLVADRQRLVPWGTQAESRRTPRSRALLRDGPWPGRITGALPNTVFTRRLLAELRDRHGALVTPSDGDLLAHDPATLTIDRRLLPAAVAAWSAPWPLHERWWRGEQASYRLQVLLADGDAWLLRFETAETGDAAAEAAAAGADSPGRWIAEAHYA